MKPIIWPGKPSISGSATIPVCLHPHMLNSAALSPIELEATWDATVGAYTHVPFAKLNGALAQPVFIDSDSAPKLLPLAVALVVTSDACFRRYLAIAAGGEQAKIHAGPVADRTQVPVNHGATYWCGDIISGYTSSAAGAGAYATLSELGQAFNRTYHESGLHETLRSVADPVLLTDADAAHKWLVFLLRRLFMNFTVKDVTDYLSSLRNAFLQTAISDVIYDSDGDAFTVSISAGFKSFLAAHYADSVKMVNFVTEIASAWLIDCESEGKFVNVGGHRLQYVSPDGVYARWFAKQDRTIHLTSVDDPEFSLDLSESTSDSIAFDSTDVQSEPDVARIYNGGQNNRLWNPPQIADPHADCGRLEDSGSPIAYAAEAGLISQEALTDVNDALLDYPEMSEKKRRKRYDVERVVPAIGDPLIQAQFAVEIPKYIKKRSGDRYVAAATQLRDEWWSVVGTELKADIEQLPELPFYEVNQVRYFVDRTPYAWQHLMTMDTLPDRASLVRSWVLRSQLNEELWRHVIMLQPSTHAICIPEALFAADAAVTADQQAYCSFCCTDIALSQGAYAININGACAVFGTEWQHCVEAYKTRAKDYAVVPGVVGGGPGDSYWWLLLELIPLTILIVVIAADSGESSQSRSEV